jgi:UDP:flavonoid glycosyltransferase YjiC (YdhE family)
MRMGWSEVGIDLKTNTPTPEALREAVRTVLDTDRYRRRALLMSEEFRMTNTPEEIVRDINRFSREVVE